MSALRFLLLVPFKRREELDMKELNRHLRASALVMRVIGCVIIIGEPLTVLGAGPQLSVSALASWVAQRIVRDAA